MTASSEPDATKTEMTRKQYTTTAEGNAMLPQFAGAANLFAHPMAGVAAAGAVGIGMAGHALGLWMGAFAGAAEAAQKFYADAEAASKPARPAGPARLTLVSSQPVARDAEPKAKPISPPKAKATVRQKVVSASKAKEPFAGTRKPAGIQRPAAPDDLKAISGVGPKLEAVLNGLGLWTWSQIAALDAAEIAWLDEHLGFSGRIGRDDWAGQATKLVAAR